MNKLFRLKNRKLPFHPLLILSCRTVNARDSFNLNIQMYRSLFFFLLFLIPFLVPGKITIAEIKRTLIIVYFNLQFEYIFELNPNSLYGAPKFFKFIYTQINIRLDVYFYSVKHFIGKRSRTLYHQIYERLGLGCLYL